MNSADLDLKFFLHFWIFLISTGSILYKSNALSVLQVLRGTLCELTSSAYKGETANIQCTYKAEHIFNTKYFFKMSVGPNIKSIYSLKGRRVLHDGRVSMSDDSQRKVLSISIDAVSESDSGLYACAVGKGHNLETFAVVRLSVMTGMYAVTFITGLERHHIGAYVL